MTSFYFAQDCHQWMPSNCDHQGQADREKSRGVRIPAMRMPPGMVESLRAVEMNALALNHDDVQLMDGACQLNCKVKGGV